MTDIRGVGGLVLRNFSEMCRNVALGGVERPIKLLYLDINVGFCPVAPTHTCINTVLGTYKNKAEQKRWLQTSKSKVTSIHLM